MWVLKPGGNSSTHCWLYCSLFAGLLLLSESTHKKNLRGTKACCRVLLNKTVNQRSLMICALVVELLLQTCRIKKSPDKSRLKFQQIRSFMETTAAIGCIFRGCSANLPPLGSYFCSTSGSNTVEFVKPTPLYFKFSQYMYHCGILFSLLIPNTLIWNNYL